MKSVLRYIMSGSLSTLLLLVTFMSSSTQSAEAAPSLSLTIWGAKLPSDGSGRKWDLNSAPDVFVRVSLGGRLLRESEVKRDETKPLWALTVGPLSEKRFYEGALIVQVIDQDLWGEEVIEEFQLATPTQEQLGQMIEVRGVHVSSLSYQWGLVQRDIWRSRRGRDQLGSGGRELRGMLGRDTERGSGRGSERESERGDEQGRRRVEEGSERGDRRTRKNTEEGARSLVSTTSKTVESDERVRAKRQLIHQAKQQRARRAALASRLYKIYLRAQFEGDQLEAHRVLIKLAQHYPYTRHGRKAQRLLLLDGR